MHSMSPTCGISDSDCPAPSAENLGTPRGPQGDPKGPVHGEVPGKIESINVVIDLKAHRLAPWHHGTVWHGTEGTMTLFNRKALVENETFFVYNHQICCFLKYRCVFRTFPSKSSQ